MLCERKRRELAAQGPKLHTSGTELMQRVPLFSFLQVAAFGREQRRTKPNETISQDAPFLVLDGLAIRRASTLLSCQ